jgi:putative two-component system response regulator
MLQVLLEGHGYEVELAGDGAEALEKARRDPPDVIVSDVLMPVMDGFVLCREWKKDEGLKAIPFVFYTAAYTDPKDEEFALSLGAERFILKPIEPVAFVEILKGLIRQHEEGALVAPREPVEEELIFIEGHRERLIKKLEDKMAELEEANRALRRLFVETIRALAAAIDAKDPYTRGHSEQVTRYAMAIARRMGFSEQQLEQIRLGGLLHDVGKIGVSDTVLNKPGKLTAEEYEAMKAHPLIGCQIIADIELLRDVVLLVRSHHERFDGQGYPSGQKGEDIPRGARIIAVADAFDAMTSDRSYRPAMAMEKVISILEEGAGAQWDAAIVKQLLDLIEEREDLLKAEWDVSALGETATAEG